MGFVKRSLRGFQRIFQDALPVEIQFQRGILTTRVEIPRQHGIVLTRILRRGVRFESAALFPLRHPRIAPKLWNTQLDSAKERASAVFTASSRWNRTPSPSFSLRTISTYFLFVFSMSSCLRCYPRQTTLFSINRESPKRGGTSVICLFIYLSHFPPLKILRDKRNKGSVFASVCLFLRNEEYVCRPP